MSKALDRRAASAQCSMTLPASPSCWNSWRTTARTCVDCSALLYVFQKSFIKQNFTNIFSTIICLKDVSFPDTKSNLVLFAWIGKCFSRHSKPFTLNLLFIHTGDGEIQGQSDRSIADQSAPNSPFDHHWTSTYIHMRQCG